MKMVIQKRNLCGLDSRRMKRIETPNCDEKETQMEEERGEDEQIDMSQQRKILDSDTCQIPGPGFMAQW